MWHGDPGAALGGGGPPGRKRPLAEGQWPGWSRAEQGLLALSPTGRERAVPGAVWVVLGGAGCPRTSRLLSGRQAPVVHHRAPNQMPQSWRGVRTDVVPFRGLRAQEAAAIPATPRAGLLWPGAPPHTPALPVGSDSAWAVSPPGHIRLSVGTSWRSCRALTPREPFGQAPGTEAGEGACWRWVL